MAATPGLVARKDGDAPAALGGAKVIKASYDFPDLAHAAMEPMSCVVQRTADRAPLFPDGKGGSLRKEAVAATSEHA